MLQYQAGMRDKVTTLGLDIVDSARAFAILNASVADALIAAWRAKYDYAYWRPITAIQLGDTDGNPATEPDPDWLPLVDTPPYPEYVSGHAPATGAASGTFSTLFGADSIDLNLSSAVTMTNRTYATAEALDMDTMNARIWLGLHFRKAMTDGNQLGHDVSGWATSNYFQPTD
ncbi:MAG: vanadium-dependent haloperoxidase [Geodermatophilaceae bacterium]